MAKESVQEEILRGYAKLTKARLKTEFERIAKQREAKCDQEIDIGVSSVAAPVLIGHIGASFSVDAVGQLCQFRKACRKEIGEELQ